jgi:L-seryl-tRNA(Ser) seleniumtransferase
MPDANRLIDLPAVFEVLERLSPALERFPRAVVVAEIRRVLDQMRRELLAGGDVSVAAEQHVLDALAALERPSLCRAINATGVVLHTNLGRAPLGATPLPAGYTNLEFDLASGRRGKRDVHASALLERLLGAGGIVVNNNAAAVFLALHELAAGGEVVVSRGELIEIGDGFRIPDIMARSGVTLREVGTTNRTHVDDYRAAITERTRLLLRVHPSNFRMSGFTARPALHDLAALGRDRGIPVYEDLGSGCLADLRPFGVDEPLVSDSLAAGADLVSFSGDKLLGGPQAGILAGRPEAVARLRRNPLFRMLRADKMTYFALEAALRNTLLERWDAIPALAMIRQTPAAIYSRAEALLARFPQIAAEIHPGKSVVGGGSTPDQELDTWLIALDSPDPESAEAALRAGDPPVVARIERDRVVLDLRTVLPGEEDELGAALAAQ